MERGPGQGFRLPRKKKATVGEAALLAQAAANQASEAAVIPARAIAKLALVVSVVAFVMSGMACAVALWRR